MSRAVMQQALEALEMMREKYSEYACAACDHADAAITALRQALAEPEQEPVAYFDPQEKGFYWAKPTVVKAPISVSVEPLPLYSAPTPKPEQHDTDCHQSGICQRSGYSIAPAPRKPVELTDPEVDDLTMAIRNAYPLIETPFYVWCRHFSRAVITEYERKNGITGGGSMSNNRDCPHGRQVGKCADCDVERLEAENETLQKELAEQARLVGMGSEREARLMALNTELVDALRWYVDTDEVSEMEGNEFWLDGRERARAALAKVGVGK